MVGNCPKYTGVDCIACLECEKCGIEQENAGIAHEFDVCIKIDAAVFRNFFHAEIVRYKRPFFCRVCFFDILVYMHIAVGFIPLDDFKIRCVSFP